MPIEPLTLTQANHLIQPLVTLPISHAWKGYGTAIFIELGALTPSAHARALHPVGEFSIYIGWDWRLEEGTRVRFGSSNNRPEMQVGLATLVGLTITSAAITGAVPEIALTLSNGQRLISAAMCSDVSEWTIRLPGSRWVACIDGEVHVDDGSDALGMSAEERIEFDFAATTAQRWGVPSSAGPAGQCRGCQRLRRLDGDANFLDYGVCTDQHSPFDARVVNLASGCQAFVAFGP